MKKENIVLRTLNNKVVIAGRLIEEIFFDLKHIQYGWNQNRKDYNHGPAKNSYTEDDIVGLFEQLNTLVQTPVEHRAKK
jgi:hypothetical protein